MCEEERLDELANVTALAIMVNAVADDKALAWAVPMDAHLRLIQDCKDFIGTQFEELRKSCKPTGTIRLDTSRRKERGGSR